MAKLSKSILKEIVKECIVEIFAESFFDKATGNEIINESINRQNNAKQRNNITKSKRPRSSQIKQQQRSSHLDNISFGKEAIQKQEVVSQQTQNSINRLTNDPVMSEIFKDTAASTLREQVGADSQRGMSIKSGGDAAAVKAYNSDPTELFGAASSKWAQLAFADPINK